MKHIWRILNLGLVAVGLAGGYASMSPERLRHTNPDVIFCLAILVITPLFAVGTVYSSIRRTGCKTLRRPSWDRHAINWWYDPLQSIFITTCIASAMAIGSACRLPAFGSVGFWTVAMYCSLAVGLAGGQFIVHRIFRERITKT
jgi:tellurite resistance protein TehA-like permease